MGKVALVNAEDDLSSAARRAVELVGGLQIKPGMKVLIKPNLCNHRNPHGMVITDFAIISSAVSMVREKGCEPTIVESDNIAGTADERLRDSGLGSKLDEWRVPFVNLSKDEGVSQMVAGTEFTLPRAVLDADYVVNLAKMKTCAHTTVTLGVKNLYGLLREAKKSRFHKKLGEILPFLAGAIRTDMTVVDGHTCMEGNGPTVGNPRSMGVVVAGTEVVSVDSLCCRLMGIDPAEVAHIAGAAEKGRGELYGYEIVGDPWEGYVCKFERPYSIRATLKTIGTLKDTYLGR
jgi:uncharacterized protein (DUF362 family)